MCLGRWHNGTGRYAVREKFNPHNPAVATFLLMTWMGVMNQAMTGMDILAHPVVPPVEPSFHIYEQPVLDVGTSSYADVDEVLGTIMQKNLYEKGAQLVMLVGDQLSYSRMVWLKIHHPGACDWVPPLPGEFHFTGDSACCVV